MEGKVRPHMCEDEAWIRAAQDEDVCLGCWHTAGDHQEGRYGEKCPCAYCYCEGFK